MNTTPAKATALQQNLPGRPDGSTGSSVAAGERHADRLDGSLLRIAGICVFASVAVNLANTAVSVAQRSLIVTFGSNQAVVAWTVTAYTLTEAAAIPLSGWAADRIGTKRLFMISVLGFTLGSVLCAVA
ncbi:MFS transporter, partial [Mycetohabitans sp. B3]|nr:MFS transporter [Mycetohabitans sp. B3]